MLQFRKSLEHARYEIDVSIHDPIVYYSLQLLGNNSSVASSTVCMNDQPCQTLVCTDNQPCTISKTPNIPALSDMTDHSDDREDLLEDFE